MASIQGYPGTQPLPSRGWGRETPCVSLPGNEEGGGGPLRKNIPEGRRQGDQEGVGQDARAWALHLSGQLSLSYFT